MHDGWMAMIVHQNVLFADFFQRHPEATRGEHIISEGMGHYLSEIRSHHPDYLSATSTLRSQGEAQGGAQRNVQGDTQNDDQGNGGQNDGGAVFGFAN
jgi:protoporphyrinogen oxidase